MWKSQHPQLGEQMIDRDVRILKFCVRVSLRVLDSSAEDVLLDPLLVRDTASMLFTVPMLHMCSLVTSNVEYEKNKCAYYN